MNHPTVSVVGGQVVACYSHDCYHMTPSGWQNLQITLLHKREAHSSAVTPMDILLIGGRESQSTTEYLSMDEGHKQSEGIHHVPERKEWHCTIQLNPTAIIITGGDDSYDRVTEYSGLGGHVTSYEHTRLAHRRKFHACGMYELANSKVHHDHDVVRKAH